MNAEFDQDNIVKFIDTLDVKANRQLYVKLEDALEIEERDCEAVNSQLRQAAEAEKAKKKEQQRLKEKAARQEL